jgi:hypothetical protein
MSDVTDLPLNGVGIRSRLALLSTLSHILTCVYDLEKTVLKNST